MIQGHWWEKDRRLINTLSNAAYPIAGIWLAVSLGDPAAWSHAATMTGLGIGSALYHWFGARFRWADWAAMYLQLAGQATAAASPGDPALWWIILAIGAGAAFLLTYAWKRVGDDVVLGLILGLAMLPPLFGTGEARLLALSSLVVFGLSKLVHSADNRRAPWIGRWGHTLWHIGTSKAFNLMYLAGSRA